MTVDLSTGSVLGLLGVIFVCARFAMKHMLRLRYFALLGNVCFIAYGLLESQLPALAINAILLPLNIRGLWEITQLSRDINRSGSAVPISQWLLPHMRRRSFAAGEVLFRKGDPADELIYVARGQLRLVEIDRPLGVGELVGEIGLFSPEKRRTQTVMCDTDGELHYMTDEMIYQLYYKNPKLGLYLIRKVVERLMNDLLRQEGKAQTT